MKRTNKKPKQRHSTKSLFSDSMPDQIHRLSLLGLTEAEISTAIGISQTTLDGWKHKKPEVAEALQKGRKIADGKVAKALYERAIGYSHPDIHIMANRVNEYDSEGNVIRSYVKPLLIPIIKHYAPESKAGIFWLKNRTRDMETPWSDRLELSTVKGGIDVNLTNLDLSDFSADELQLLMKLSSKLNIKGVEE